ncbi:hypothetical protein EVJ58_g8100 [Rhodofomes roseus]|uniref:Uncharacterized protein n=1 Tax=Rhodofomes roseus TaxID=34475 RepID=A0A4Y9Y000_9APHY|nr:hypothetical protein EVJ58_g8100 [Rhodofomes roseus]
MIKVGLGEWYKHAEGWKAIYAEAAREAEVDDAFEVFGIDERGRRTDGKEWAKHAETAKGLPAGLEEFIAPSAPSVDLSREERWAHEDARVKQMLAHKEEIAAARAQARHPNVLTP